MVGTQWGDEGKGKFTDLSPRRCRSSSATRAATTPATPSSSTGSHSPSSSSRAGILYPWVTPVIGNGVVVDPVVLVEEMDALEARGIDCSRLKVSGNAHLILPYHSELDRLTERKLGKNKPGHHQAGHRAGLRRQGGAGRPAGPGPARPQDLPGQARDRPQREEPDPGQDPQPPTPLGRRHLRPVPGRPADPDRAHDRRLGRARPRRPRGGRQRAVRRRPGHVPRRRPRHLSVRHVVEPGGRRGAASAPAWAPCTSRR
jgi:hypothetical protein